MKMNRKIWALVWLSLLWACSTNETEMAAEEDLVPSFVLVGIDAENVYQYNYDGLEDKAATFNLSQELGLGANYLTLRQVGQQLSFYTFSNGAFSLYQKDVLTGSTDLFLDFYENTDARSIVWGTNDASSVYFGYYSPRGSSNLALYSYHLATLQGVDTPLEFNIQELYPPLYEDGKLYITYQSGSGAFKLAIYDTFQATVVQNVDYGSARPSIFMADNGDLAIITLGPNGITELELRSTETFLVQTKQVLNLNQVFSPGPLNAQLRDEKLYYEFEFAQPFSINKGPAIYDLGTDENLVLDMDGILKQLSSETGLSINILTSVYVKDTDAFLFGYGKVTNDDRLEGGVLAISSEGKLLKQLSLPFVPTYFLK
jgi:hypothetical protein